MFYSLGSWTTDKLTKAILSSPRLADEDDDDDDDCDDDDDDDDDVDDEDLFWCQCFTTFSLCQ